MPPLPATEGQLCYFVGFLGTRASGIRQLNRTCRLFATSRCRRERGTQNGDNVKTGTGDPRVKKEQAG